MGTTLQHDAMARLNMAILTLRNAFAQVTDTEGTLESLYRARARFAKESGVSEEYGFAGEGR